LQKKHITEIKKLRLVDSIQILPSETSLNQNVKLDITQQRTNLIELGKIL